MERHFSLVDGKRLVGDTPKAWSELDEEELRFVLSLIAKARPAMEVKVKTLMRLAGITTDRKMERAFRLYLTGKNGRKKYFFLYAWQVEQMAHAYDFIDDVEGYDARISSIGGYDAVEESLHGMRFDCYLKAESYYQTFLRTQEDDSLDLLGQLLFPAGDGVIDTDLVLEPWQRLHCFLWFRRVKGEMASFFPHLLKPHRRSEDKEVNDVDVVAMMNMQLRALTGGDVTKEEYIRAMDCWRALTELDAKAQDAEEYKRKMKK